MSKSETKSDTPATRLPPPGIIATIFASRQQPQAGQLLKRLREARGWTQVDLALRMGTEDRSAVATWEGGRRWPTGGKLEKLTLLMTGDSLVVDSNVAADEIASLLDTLKAAGHDELQIADGLITYGYPKVLATLILKATGPHADARAIDLFFQHRKDVRLERAQNSLGAARNVSPAQAAAVDRNVYETSDLAPGPTPAVEPGEQGLAGHPEPASDPDPAEQPPTSCGLVRQ